MDDHFKFPSLDVKHKFVARKPQANDQPATATAAAPHVDGGGEEITADTADVAVAGDQPPITGRPDDTTTTTTPTVPAKPRSVPHPQICPYAEPQWSAPPAAEHVYHIEMLKNGTIVETVANLQSRPFWLIGKLADNHIVMAHPTVSRFHAVLQFRPTIEPIDTTTTADGETVAAAADAVPAAARPRIESGWYLYDLGSTHGSFVNKRKIPAKTYVRLRVGYMLSFGGSTRRLILQGPDFDAEPESELGITEQRQRRAQQLADASAAEQLERDRVAEEERRRDAEGASWGMGAEDADAETDLSVNPYATTNNEELFLQDPKRTLRGYFEREGLELEYKVDELAAGSFVCKIELPICDPSGRPIRCEVSHKGKKKECVAAGALEACRLLDRHGVLRQSHHESRKRKVQHSDSDGDDEFYDRTGAVERKRVEKDADKQQQLEKALSYVELQAQEVDVLAKLAAVQERIERYQATERRAKEQMAANEDASAEQDLDAFMRQLAGETKFDRTEIRRLRVELKEIEADHRQLRRLIGIARPVDLPPLIGGGAVGEKKVLALPLFGKRGKFQFGATAAAAAATVVRGTPAASGGVDNGKEVEEEVEDEVPAKRVADVLNEEIIAPTERGKVASPPANTTAEVVVPPPDNADMRHVEAVDDAAAAADADAAAARKKRSRPRIRGERGRDNIDMDEPAANSDKYSTWVPPENQSGDGSTSLNDKFGY